MHPSDQFRILFLLEVQTTASRFIRVLTYWLIHLPAPFCVEHLVLLTKRQSLSTRSSLFLSKLSSSRLMIFVPLFQLILLLEKAQPSKAKIFYITFPKTRTKHSETIPCNKSSSTILTCQQRASTFSLKCYLSSPSSAYVLTLSLKPQLKSQKL